MIGFGGNLQWSPNSIAVLEAVQPAVTTLHFWGPITLMTLIRVQHLPRETIFYTIKLVFINKNIQVIQNIFLPQSGIKLEVNYRNICGISEII